MSLQIRVVVEHIPDRQYALLGLALESECLPVLEVGGLTFYRAHSTPRYVLYKRALEGYDERTPLHPAQR